MQTSILINYPILEMQIIASP